MAAASLVLEVRTGFVSHLLIQSLLSGTFWKAPNDTSIDGKINIKKNQTNTNRSLFLQQHIVQKKSRKLHLPLKQLCHVVCLQLLLWKLERGSIKSLLQFVKLCRAGKQEKSFSFSFAYCQNGKHHSETSPEHNVLPAEFINSNILVCKNTLLLLKYSKEKRASLALNSGGHLTFLSWPIRLNFWIMPFPPGFLSCDYMNWVGKTNVKFWFSEGSW